METPLPEPLCIKLVGLHFYQKENLECEIFLTAFVKNTYGQLLLKGGSTIYLKFPEQTLF